MTEKRSAFPNHLAALLDNKFRIPGTNIRFGMDPVIGLIPGAGDILTGGISIYFLVKAARFGASVSVLVRMSLNILLEVLVGSVPILGDAFDVYWKANLRNARILEEHQQHPRKTHTQSRLLLWAVVVVFIALLAGILLLMGWFIAELMHVIA